MTQFSWKRDNHCNPLHTAEKPAVPDGNYTPRGQINPASIFPEFHGNSGCIHPDRVDGRPSRKFDLNAPQRVPLDGDFGFPRSVFGAALSCVATYRSQSRATLKSTDAARRNPTKSSVPPNSAELPRSSGLSKRLRCLRILAGQQLVQPSGGYRENTSRRQASSQPCSLKSSNAIDLRDYSSRLSCFPNNWGEGEI